MTEEDDETAELMDAGTPVSGSDQGGIDLDEALDDDFERFADMEDDYDSFARGSGRKKAKRAEELDEYQDEDDYLDD